MTHPASGGGLTTSGTRAVMTLAILVTVVDLKMTSGMSHRGCCCILMPQAVV